MKPNCARVLVENVCFEYPGGIEALKGVSLAVGEEAVAVIGRNGGGKTTLMKHLNGLLRPKSGRVLIEGEDIAPLSVAKVARRVALSFQNPDDQLFNRTVESEVAFGPRNVGLDEQKAAANVNWALELFELEPYRKENPSDLSFSLRKRVAIASAAAMDTSILVLDEPTTGQDHHGIELLERLIRELRQRGKTVITVTHDMEFVARNFPRVVVIAEGLVRADGPCNVVFRDQEALALAQVAPPLAARLAADAGWEGEIHTFEKLNAELKRSISA